MKLTDPPDIQGGIRAKDDPGWIHQKEIGIAEAGGLDGPEDIRGVAARHAPEDIRSGQRGLVQEVGDVVGGDPEFTEAVKEIRPAAGPCPAGDVVDVAAFRDGRIQPR